MTKMFGNSCFSKIIAENQTRFRLFNQFFGVKLMKTVEAYGVFNLVPTQCRCLELYKAMTK